MEVDVKVRDGVIVLKPDGRLIGAATDALEAVIEAQQKVASAPFAFLFDFADVPRIDSSGLRVLLGLYVSVVRQGGRVGLINANPTIYKVFAMTRLFTCIEWYDTETEAIAALRG